ncbi:MAG: tetratricopeptide repeat protein [Chloroflexota bacterium]
MSNLALSFLGPPRIERDGLVVEVGHRKGVALLAYLAVTTAPHGRDSLATLFWPDSDPSHARGALRYTLAALKKSLGEGWLLADHLSLGLNPAAAIQVDVARFRQLLGGSGRRRPAKGSDELSPDHPIPSLTEAVALYRGDFLAGFTLDDSPLFDEWQSFETESLRQEMTRALETLVKEHGAAGQWETAISHARRWLLLDPWHEPAHAWLMQLYAQSDQRAAALRQYEECARVLDRELGVEPSASLKQLKQRIQAGVWPPKVAAPADGQPPAGTFHHVPYWGASFVGRQRERAELRAKLAGPHCRLLTLVGPGGVGKTRLAVQTLVENQWPHPIYYVNLTPLTSPDQLPMAVADALALNLDGRDTPHRQLLNHLRQQELLLLLDNFEHLAAGADFLAAVLAAAPQVRLVVTSREVLGLEEEWLYEVAGLDYPGREEGMRRSTTFAIPPSPPPGQYSAVQLLIERARQARHDFAPAAEWPGLVAVCQLVEGMPLALELAAVWVRLLSCQAIAQEIQRGLNVLTTTHRQVELRHRSMRAVFEQSWRLLSPREQAILAQLSVFQGGFSRPAATAVAGAALYDLLSLVNKSLLRQVDQGRFDLHELLRQFAAEKLALDPAAAGQAHGRHAQFYGSFLSQLVAEHGVREEGRTYQAIRNDLDNVRAGWQWAAGRDHLALLEQYVIPLYDFYAATNRYQEGQAVFGLALATVTGQMEGSVSQPRRPTLDSLLIAKLKARQAEFCHELGDTETAERLLQECLARLQRRPDDAETAFVYRLMGLIRYHQGRYQEAKTCLRSSVEAGRSLVPLFFKANTALLIGAVCFALGQYDEAQTWHRESLALYQEIGQGWGVAHALRWLGTTAARLNDDEAARRLYQQSLEAFEEAGNPFGQVTCLNDLGALAQKQGDYPQAQIWFQRAWRLCQEHDLPLPLARTLQHLGDLATEQGDYPAAQDFYRQAMPLAVNAQATPVALQVLTGAAELLARMDDGLVGAGAAGEKALMETNTAKAFALLNLVVNHPASNQATRERARPLLNGLAGRLPAVAVDVLTEQASHLPLEQAVVALLTEPNETLSK